MPVRLSSTGCIKLIFYQAEAWVFTLIYTAFAALVVLAWYLAPPSSFPRRRESSE